MITINVVKMNNVEYYRGSIGKQKYNVLATEEIKDYLVNAQNAINECEVYADAQVIMEETFKAINEFRIADDSSLEEVLKDDLYFNKKTKTYHLKIGDKVGKDSVHKFFVNKMIEANDKQLSPRPWLIFWVRLMRNPLYNGNLAKIQTLVNYLSALYTCEKTSKELVEKEGYSSAVADEMSTFEQISITEEGILAAFKYVNFVDHKFIVVKNEETGEQEVVKKDKYERELEVDEVTGKIIKDELKLPTESEDYTFYPPMMGLTGGDPFTCASLHGDNGSEAELGHIIKVGKVHELTKGFHQVDTSDSRSCVPGLHLGGHYYVQGYGGKTAYLLDCLVSPEDIGAVCDVTAHGSDGAIRCRRYMAVGAHFTVSRGMYHPSKYAKMLDGEWDTAKEAAIGKLLAQVEDTKEQF